MPRGDRTGPWGQGPMTGRRAGYCAGYDVPGYLNDVPAGRGWGSGWGRGRGWGYGHGPGYGRGYGFRWGLRHGGPWYAGPLTPEEERTWLENELRYAERWQEDLRKRLDELKGKEEKGEEA